MERVPGRLEVVWPSKPPVVCAPSGTGRQACSRADIKSMPGIGVQEVQSRQ